MLPLLTGGIGPAPIGIGRAPIGIPGGAAPGGRACDMACATGASADSVLRGIILMDVVFLSGRITANAARGRSLSGSYLNCCGNATPARTQARNNRGGASPKNVGQDDARREGACDFPPRRCV